jgi:hypothetical protein
MKSAYEIAMEKMRASSGPDRKLTEEQKERIAEIDRRYNAKVAEAKLTFDGKLAGAPPAERAAVEQERVSELTRLDEQREAEKESVWNEAAG